jgi:hypothetical protein
VVIQKLSRRCAAPPKKIEFWPVFSRFMAYLAGLPMVVLRN